MKIIGLLQITISSLLFSLLLHPALFAHEPWKKISVPSSAWLRSVYFTDSLYGWAAGDSGTLLHTTDGGKTWNHQPVNLNYEIAEVFFLNRQVGWASAFNYSDPPFGTKMLTTKDGGTTWTISDYPKEEAFITCITFRDSLHGWVGGKPHVIARTEDGGMTWHEAAMDTSTLAFFPVLNILFYNDKYGWACGGMFDIAGVVWRTTDGGNKWYAIDPVYAPADEVHALHAFDSLHVMGAGGDPDFGYGVGMIRSFDGGVVWQYKECSIPGFAVDLDFRTPTEAWASLGIRRQLIFSYDSGNNWQAMTTPDSVEIYDMIFPDSLHGFAVGKHGAVLKYIGPSVDGTEELSGKRDDYILFVCNPNPFQDQTTIRYHCPVGERNTAKTPGTHPLIFKLTDMTGNTIRILELPEDTPGDHELTLERENLKPGIYIGVLETGRNPSATRSTPVKMVVSPY